MRSVMKSMFLPFLLISLFATTKAAAGAALCADVDAALQTCDTIFKTGNLNDPSFDGCCAGLNKIATISATIGAKAACQCVHAALGIAANPTSVAVGISAQVPEKCGINLGFSIDATVGC
ncbi:non-specific lipid-transfer protein 1-like [Quercus robur]|uniref:non-specific lipid-transfer protein 1-like n=1 Tax=Quercus robur TaxID=38942 RepID=UPI0021627672|nr:non-specific lipid-transfer protein 1-like [Quercus robur]